MIESSAQCATVVCMTCPMQSPGAIYPTRKRRILENFPLETSPNQERPYYDCDNLDDEVQVLCVVSGRPPKVDPETQPRLSYFKPPLHHHPVTLLPRDDPIQAGKSSWPCLPITALDKPSRPMNDCPRPLKLPSRTDWKMLYHLSDNTWIEVEVPTDGLNNEDQGSPLPPHTLQSLFEPKDHYPHSDSSLSNCYYPISLPSQTCESNPPSPNHQVQSPSRAIEALRYSLSPPEKALNRRPLFDPKDSSWRDMRQPICSICMAPAESFHLNFGATSCSSCRAFFRRCVLKNLYQGLVCHYGRRCVLSVDNRSDCRKCRFDKCIQQGMKCSAVLSHTQKMTRFRKHIARKQLQKINEKMELKRTLRTFRRTRSQKVKIE